MQKIKLIKALLALTILALSTGCILTDQAGKEPAEPELPEAPVYTEITTPEPAPTTPSTPTTPTTPTTPSTPTTPATPTAPSTQPTPPEPTISAGFEEITSCQKNREENPNASALVQASGIEYSKASNSPLLPIYTPKTPGNKTITLKIGNLYTDDNLNPEYPEKEECGTRDDKLVKEVKRTYTGIEVTGKKVLFDGQDSLSLAAQDTTITVTLPENLGDRFTTAFIEVKVKGLKTLKERDCISGTTQERETEYEFNCAFYIDE